MKTEHSRHDFITNSSLAGLYALTVPLIGFADQKGNNAFLTRYKKYFNIK